MGAGSDKANGEATTLETHLLPKAGVSAVTVPTLHWTNRETRGRASVSCPFLPRAEAGSGVTL